MHNLDKILDDVRCKYYHYDKMKRPTISWSEDYITDYFGEYNFHNNHIIVSRVLDDSRVSENMLASVIYHESLHQQFAEHDEYFMEKARLFPNYDKLFDKLSAFVDTVHNELEVKLNYNNFTKNKKRIVYIVLPYGEDYMNAFFNRDGKILVDFNATVNFDIHDDNSDLFVFLVENANQYHIVGWCTKGKLLKRMCFVQHSILGDCDYSYQMVTDYDSIYIVPDTCCDWRIDKTDFPKGFIKSKCCCYDISDECIQPDIEYVNSYSEGYMKPFFDVKVINSIPEFDNVTAEELKTIEFEGLRKVLLQNAIYEIEPTFDNLVNRAIARHDVWFLSAALDDFILVNKMEPQDIPAVYDIIRIAVLCGKTDIAREFIEKYKTELPTDDDVLNNCINFVFKVDN